MSYRPPQEIAQTSIEVGTRKTHLPFHSLMALGFLAGAFIALGFLLDIRVVATVPKEWGSFTAFLGAAVFPVGLILTIIAGGELLTGNMMAVTMAALARKITWGMLLKNWFWITVSNFLGSLFVAYFFGHVLGLTEGAALARTIATAEAKLDQTFFQMFLSGIGCNWFVALAVWLSYGAEDVGGKILGIWFPIMAFVAIGFQHVVANMFLLPAAIFAGHADWGDFFYNFVPVYLGNAVGGGIFVAGFYWVSYIWRVKQA